MQVLYKMIASFLSVALIFTSVAPSFAQVLQTPKVGFRVSASNSLEEAFTRQLAKVQQQSEEEYWVGRGEVLTGEISKYHYWEDLSAKLLEASNQVNGYIEQAVVCSADNTECIPALAYAWGGIHRGIKDENLYSRGQIIDSVAPDFAWIVSNYGIYSESDRKEAVRYFYDLVKMAKNDCTNGAFEYGSPSHRADQRIASERQAKKCATEVSVIPALAMISKGSAEEQKAAQTFYDLLEDKYDTAVGGAVIQACVTGLGVLGTPKAYSLLEKFLTEDTIPSTTGNVFAGIGSPFQSLAQNGLRVASNVRGGNSRYLNRINENLQYLDKQEAKRQGFQTTSWQGEAIQYPYANMLEEVGAFLGQQSASNVYARALAKKLVGQANEAAKTQTNAAGTLHYPLVLGIMDGWRAHGKKFIYEPTRELINFFYKGDWFDINEGTQQRVHYKAYQFARARGWTPELPKRDQAKIQRTIYNSRLMTIGGAGDGVLTVLMTGYLVKSIPALLRGIPQGVKILSSHKTWVGAANYFKNAPKSMWTRVKGGPRAQEITLKPTTQARPAQTTARTRTAQNPARQPAKPTGQNAPRQGYTTVDMGMQNGQRTVAIATTPEQQAALTAQRANIAPKTFASTGDGFANAGKTQVLVDEAAATGQQGQAAAQAAGHAVPTAQPITPRWIQVETTNALGNTVKTWKPNPAHPEYNRILAELSGQSSGARQLGWLDRARLNWAINWKPAFQNMFKFGTSRYGLAATAPGATPVTSEAAIAQAAEAPTIVQTVRAQQSAFIAEEFLRGGAGASYRVGAVNPGGITSQQFAAQMLQTTNTKATLARAGYTLLNPMNAWAKAAALIPAGLLASLLFGSDVGLSDGLSTTLTMASMWGMPSFLKSPEERKKQALLDQLDAVVKQLEAFAQAHNGLLPYYVTDCTEEEKRLEDLAYKYEAQLKNLGLQNHTIIQTYHELREQSFANNQRQLLRKSTDGASSETVMQNSNVETDKQQPTVVTAAQQLAKIYQGGNARTPKEQRKLDRTVKRLAEHLTQLEAFAHRYNGRLPSTTATVSPANYTTDEDASLINSVERDIEFLKGQGFQNDPLSQRYAKLVEAHKDYLVKRLTGSLDILEKFAREHDGKLPYKSNALLSKLYGTEQEIALREQVAQDIKSLNKLIWGENHDQVLAERCTPLFNRYNQLVQTHQQQMKQENKTLLQTERQKEQEEARQNKLQQKEEKRREEQERQELQKEWEEEQARLEKQALIEEAAVRRQDREWAQYEEALADETTADRAARTADSRIAWLGQTTEDFIVQLVNFYNNINPFGDAALNIPFNRPEQWADELQKFIDKHHRAPNRYVEKEITSQQMKDENRLAKSVYGLLTRLPERDPNWQRLENLMASVGMDKQTRIQHTQARQQTAFEKLRQGYQTWSTEQKFISAQELYQQLVKYVQESKRYPLANSYLYRTIYGRLKYYQSTMVNGKYADPWLQKIYELKTALQAAENGNIRLEKQGENYVVVVTQATTAAQTPQKHALVLQVNELTGQILEQVGAQAALQRTHYASWLRQAHDKGYVVGDDATYKVLFNVERMVQNYANLNMAQRTLVNDVLDTLGQYQALVGRQKGGFFYKIAYKGTEDTLLAQNFYLQAERTGWEWDADSPDKEIEKISEAMGNSGYLASLEEDVEEEFASKIVFYDKAEVTPEVAKKHLNDLLKVFNDLGYTVRMGTHELGLVQNKDNTFTVSSAFRTGRLHIHLEHAPDPEAEIPVGINIRFYIDASPFIGRNWTDDEIAANYFGLFRSSLTQEAKHALAQIVKSSTKK